MKYTGLVLSLLFSATSFAQNNSRYYYSNSNNNDAKNSEIVMTKSELKDFLQTVADARRQKLEKVQEREDEIELLKARVRYYKEKSELGQEPAPTAKRSKSCCKVKPKKTDNSQDYAELVDKMDALLEVLASKMDKPEVIYADSNNSSKSDDLRSQLASIESRLKNAADAKERKSILEDLLERYGNFRKQVFFANDSKAVTQNDLNYIAEVAEVLRNHKELSIVLEGYASPVGPVVYNKNLSMQRAEAVSQAIQRFGISSDRIFPAFKGEDHSGTDEYARRVDMTIVVK